MKERFYRNEEEVVGSGQSVNPSSGRSASLYTKERVALHNGFFDTLIEDLKLDKVDEDIIAVLHILPDAIPFTRAI